MYSSTPHTYCESEITLELPDGTKIVVRPTIGVKQGAVPSPISFIFLMMAFVDTMPWPEDVPAITFKWAWDGDLRQHHRSEDQKQHDAMASGTAQVRHLDYADDLALLFAGTADLAKTFPILCRHGRRWSLELHLTRGEEVSKTFAVYVPSPSNPRSEADLTPIPVPAVEVAGTFTEPGTVTFETKAEILGTIFTDDLLDEVDVTRRIKKAAQVFGALRKTVFATRHQSLAVKREVYEAAVIGTLWYGSEGWRLRQSDLARLQSFHRRCVRAMVGVNLWQTRHRHIHTSTLLRRMGIKPISYYLDENFLGHIGRVAKLPRHSLAKQVLGMYSTEKWARGRPQEHTRHRLRSALNTRMKFIDTSLQDKFRVRRPCRTRRKNGQDYVERPPLVEWGGWHLIAGGKDRESRALWKKITKLHEMPQEGPPPEVPINV